MVETGKLFKILALITIVFFLVEIVYYVVFLNTWFDEADFCYKSWLTSQNLAQPFQDFRTKHPPASFYLQEFLQEISGPTIIGSRILSALFLIGIAVLLFGICRKIGGKWIGLLAVSFLAFNPYLVGYFSSAKDYSWAVFFPLLAIWIISLDKLKTRNKIFLSSLAMGLSVLMRYNMLPALIVLWIYIFFRWKNWKYLAVSVGSSSALIIISMIPYFRLDAEYALIWFFMMFGPLTKLLPYDYFKIFTSSLFSNGNLLSYVEGSLHYWKGCLYYLIRLFTKFFHLWVVFFVSILMAFKIKKGEMRNFFDENHLTVFAALLTIIFFVSHFLIPTEFASFNHSLYFAPFLIISAAGSIYIFYNYLEKNGVWKYVQFPLGIFLIITVVFSVVSLGLSGPDVIFFNHFNYNDSDLSRIKRGSEYLKSLTSPDDIILTLDNPHHVFLAGRYEIPPLINGELTYYDIENSNLLERYAFYNAPMLIDWLKNKATVVVFQRDQLTDSAIKNTESLEEFEDILKEKFELVGSIENVYHRKNTRTGIMDIYRKK